jgi:hypothetical protein
MAQASKDVSYLEWTIFGDLHRVADRLRDDFVPNRLEPRCDLGPRKESTPPTANDPLGKSRLTCHFGPLGPGATMPMR